MTHPSVTIQITSASVPAVPSWMGEVAALAQVLSHVGVLKAIQEQVHFARARFDTYELIDFVAVLIGYAVSGEPTLLADLANGSRHLPNRSWLCLIAHQLPHRSTFSRFLAALDQSHPTRNPTVRQSLW